MNLDRKALPKLFGYRYNSNGSCILGIAGIVYGVSKRKNINGSSITDNTDRAVNGVMFGVAGGVVDLIVDTLPKQTQLIIRSVFLGCIGLSLLYEYTQS